MTDPTESEKMRTTIEMALGEASILLTRAQHETMKAKVRGAQRDLNEGLVFLETRDISDPDSRARMAEMTVEKALIEMAAVRKHLDTYGPHAEFVG